MGFIFTCPFCGQHIDCDDELEGQDAKCPTCGEDIVPVRPVWEPYAADMQTDDDDEIEPAECFLHRVWRVVSGALRHRAEVQTADAASPAVKPFERPLLAAVFRIGGLFWVAFAGLFLCLPLLFREFNWLPSIVGAMICAGFAIIPFGIAQIITYVGKTAYNSDRMVDLLTELKKRK